MAMTKTLSMISRTGRDLQRYNDGCRQVVGCVLIFDFFWLNIKKVEIFICGVVFNFENNFWVCLSDLSVNFYQWRRCIPYRYRKTNQSSTVQGTQIDDLEFLLISSQKSPKWMFPKV